MDRSLARPFFSLSLAPGSDQGPGFPSVATISGRGAVTRRTALAGLGALVLPVSAAAAIPRGPARLAVLEAASGGRLGVWVRDTGTGRGFGWRADERFALCSTWKLSLAARVLEAIEMGLTSADTIVPYSVLDVLDHSPVALAMGGQGGLPVLRLAQAAVEDSDNLAANLLLDRLGGPAALTAWWRAHGDMETRLDRPELAMNRVPPGDPRDTTTPRAMAQTVERMVMGPILTPGSRAVLWGWMKAARTGLDRLRAGLPAGWQAGDKTGTFADPHFPTCINDIALLLPPVDHPRFRAPLAIAAYWQPAGPHDAVAPGDEAVLARVAQIATDPRSWGG